MTQAARAEQTPAPAPRARKPTLKVGGSPPPQTAAAAASAAVSAAAIARIVPSAPRIFELRQLVRAKENVRHVRVDEDVRPLADNIAAVGLLQGLIGYVTLFGEEVEKVHIVGGGRRLQALMLLWEDGRIDGRFTVPVLIRDVDDAIELSLAENLQQRTMSPVDEFHAFKALMDRGDTSPRQLAARFGFSETVVKQRLRLADLVPEVLDALADRRITIDAATAYASTQDRTLQLEVFRLQERKSWDQHRPANIRSDVGLKGMRTTDPVFRFVGAAAYEAEGGGYEDDLFGAGADANRDGRILDKPYLARAIGERIITDQAPALIEQLRADRKRSPNIIGHVTPSSLRMQGTAHDPYLAHGEKLQLPTGFVDTGDRARDTDRLWKALRDRQTEIHVIVGIDHHSQLSAAAGRVLLPKAEKAKIEGAEQAQRGPELTPKERAAQERQLAIGMWAKRLAIGLKGTRLEDVAVFPRDTVDRAERREHLGQKGWAVPLTIFVSDAAVDAALPAAEALVDAKAAIAAEQVSA